MLTIEEVKNSMDKEEKVYVARDNGYLCVNINDAVIEFTDLRAQLLRTANIMVGRIPQSTIDEVNAILNRYDAMLHDLKLAYVSAK